MQLTPPPQPALDIVSAAIKASAFVFGSEAAAQYIGPYLVIIVASCVGAYLGTVKDDTKTSMATLVNAAVGTLAAVLVTVSISMVCAKYTPFEAQVWFVPIAGLIGFRYKQIPSDLGRLWGFGTRLLGDWLRLRFRETEK